MNKTKQLIDFVGCCFICGGVTYLLVSIVDTTQVHFINMDTGTDTLKSMASCTEIINGDLIATLKGKDVIPDGLDAKVLGYSVPNDSNPRVIDLIPVYDMNPHY